MKPVFILLCCLFFCAGCHRQYTADYLLTLTNDSNISITCGIQFSITDPRISLHDVVAPYASEWLRWGVEKTGSWRHPFSEHDTLTFYIFKGDIDIKYQSIIYLDYDIFTPVVLARYYFTLQDMECLDWKFSYPPNEAMKDIKMDPPYSSFTDNVQQ